ncbi:MAG: ABC transporter ATP-binding protein [Coriobacteriia bacterium]|jgi:branched-chain amino acid transport system permease protein|nr:ABC transporter ATP-binding protein [Coriobacteriia bacterium]
MGGSKMDVSTKVENGKASPMKKVLLTAFFLVVFLAPIVFQGFGQMFMVRILAVVGLYVMLALGLNIVVGYAGLLDLGYIAFYGIGAYAGVLGGVPLATWLTAQFPDVAWLPGISYFAMLPVAALAGAITGVMLGTPVLRLRGDYLAIVTLGFGEIVRIALNNNIFGITNGAAGLPKAGMVMPKPLGFQWLSTNAYFSLPNLGSKGFTFTFNTNIYWYYVIVLLCLFTVFVVRRLDDSRLGRSWTAMREDEVAAASMGVNIMGTKLWAFALGALWGGIAGITFANFQGFVSPESFTFMESVFVVSIVVIGGMGSIWGAVVGALFIQGIPELIRGAAQAGWLEVVGITLSGEAQSAISNYRYLVFGFLMVLMMALRPQGIIPSKRRARELHPEDTKALDEMDQTLYDAEHRTAMPGDDL